MRDGQVKFTSDKTGRQYTIKRHYTCQDTWVVYYIRCKMCKVGYVGQTTTKLAQRHLAHRAGKKSDRGKREWGNILRRNMGRVWT